MAPAPPACAYLHVRPWSYLHGGMRVSSRAWSLTCTAMVILARVCAHLHGYTCTAMARKPTRRDQRPAPQIPNQPRQANTLNLRYTSRQIQASNPTHPNSNVQRLGGMGVNDGVDAAATSTTTTGGGCTYAIGPKGPMIVRPEGRTDGTPEGQPASSGLIVEPKGSTGAAASQRRPA